MNSNLVMHEIPLVRVIMTADSLDGIRSEILAFIPAPETVSDETLQELLYREYPVLSGQPQVLADENSCTPGIPSGVWHPVLSRRRIVSSEIVKKHYAAF